MQSVQFLQKNSKTALLMILTLPQLAFAQPTSFANLVNVLIGIINIIVPLIFGLLFVYMVWKVIDAWIIHGGDQAKREEGKKYAIVAIIVFVVMLSAYGIVAMIRRTIFG